jgi:hypothetical protein
MSWIAPERCFVITVDFKGAEPFTCFVMHTLSFRTFFTFEADKSSSRAINDRLWPPSYFKIFIFESHAAGGLQSRFAAFVYAPNYFVSLRNAKFSTSRKFYCIP